VAIGLVFVGRPSWPPPVAQASLPVAVGLVFVGRPSWPPRVAQASLPVILVAQASLPVICRSEMLNNLKS